VKRFAAVWFGVLALSAFAHGEDLPIETSSELRDWCRTQTREYFVDQGKTPFNWTASHRTQGNLLEVRGKWRIDGVDVMVECHVARGAKRADASFSLGEEV